MSYIALLFAVLAACALRAYAILPRTQRIVGARKPKDGCPTAATCKLSVFLGSGGHTSESLAMISALDFARYSPRVYYVSEGDTLSAHKAVALEQSKHAAAAGYENRRETRSEPASARHENDIANAAGASGLDLPYRIVVIPRARRVHQSLLTAPASALVSLLSCIYYVALEPLLSPRTGSSTTTRPSIRDDDTAKDSVLVLNGPGTCLMLCVAVYINRFFALPSPKIIYIESFARVRSLSLSGKLIRPLADRFIVQWPQLLKNVSKAEYRGCLV